MVPGLSLQEASTTLAQRVDIRGEIGEAVVHDPVYPLFVSDEGTTYTDYTLYNSLEDMVARAAKKSLKARLTLSEDGLVTVATLIDIRSDPPVITLGISLRSVSDLVAYETLLETAALLRARTDP